MSDRKESLHKNLPDLNRCRVCGLYFEDYQPWGEDGTCPQYDICPCCGVEFGYEDFEIFSLRKYRKQWIDNGCKWDSPICRPSNWSYLESIDWLKTMDSRLLFERIVTDLYATPYFAGFKCSKTESRIYKITSETTLEIKFSCSDSAGRDDIEETVIVTPVYSVRFNNLHEWWKRVYKRPISEYDSSGVRLTGNSYTFHFDEQRYTEEFATLCNDVISYAKGLFDRFGTTGEFYQNNVVPMLERETWRPENVSQLSIAEKEKLSNDARSVIAKRYGFKQYDYFNWTIRNGYLFTVFNGTLRVKPLYVDELLKKFLQIDSNMNEPISLCSIGIFTANDYVIQTYKEPFVEKHDDSDYTKDNCLKLWDGVFRLITKSINSFLRYNPDAEKFDITKRGRYNR